MTYLQEIYQIGNASDSFQLIANYTVETRYKDTELIVPTKMGRISLFIMREDIDIPPSDSGLQVATSAEMAMLGIKPVEFVLADHLKDHDLHVDTPDELQQFGAGKILEALSSVIGDVDPSEEAQISGYKEPEVEDDTKEGEALDTIFNYIANRAQQSPRPAPKVTGDDNRPFPGQYM